MRLPFGVCVVPNNIATRINPKGLRDNGPWEINGRESAVSGSQETVNLARGISEHPHNIASGIDVPGLREIAIGHIEGREAAVLDEVAVREAGRQVVEQADDRASVWSRAIVHGRWDVNGSEAAVRVPHEAEHGWVVKRLCVVVAAVDASAGRDSLKDRTWVPREQHGREGALAQQKAMEGGRLCPPRSPIVSHNVPARVDPPRLGGQGTREINRGKVSAAHQEPVIHPGGVSVRPDDVAARIDTESGRGHGVWEIKAGELKRPPRACGAQQQRRDNDDPER